MVVCLLTTAANPQSSVSTKLRAIDTPNDSGNSITLILPETRSENTRYRITYSETSSGPFELLKEIQADPTADGNQKVLVTSLPRPNGSVYPIETGKTIYFKVTASTDGTMLIGGAVPASAQPNYFNTDQTTNFIFVIAFTVVLFLSIGTTRKGGLNIRRLPGLEALDEALGRATEMGRQVLFVHGLQEISQASTIAAVNVLGQVARRAAEFDTELKVATRFPLTMSVSQEVVREACVEAGRPDAFNADNIFLAAADQFSYAAALEGHMMREKPAANILMGYFYAESLLLAETGSRTGAIQIAGSDAYAQLPFFVTTCDYTLMGEELYAASAYLSRDARLLGSIKTQDLAKGLIVAIILVGAVASAIGYDLVGKVLGLT